MYRTFRYHFDHQHDARARAGYLVVRITLLPDDAFTETVMFEVEGADSYPRALALLGELHATLGPHQHDAICTLYTCGCDTGMDAVIKAETFYGF